MIVTIAVRYFHGPNDARTILVERDVDKDRAPGPRDDGFVVEGAIVDGAGVFAPGQAILFFPIRRLIWSVIREKVVDPTELARHRAEVAP